VKIAGSGVGSGAGSVSLRYGSGFGSGSVGQGVAPGSIRAARMVNSGNVGIEAILIPSKRFFVNFFAQINFFSKML
jgi:hypothetical protein